MKAFIDWGIRKEHKICFEDNITVESVTTQQLIEKIRKRGITELYMEQSAPRAMLYDIMKQGVRIYVIDSKIVKQVREQMQTEKSDVMDTLFIRNVYRLSPQVFHELTEPEKRELELKWLMLHYLDFDKFSVAHQNILKAHEREFGEVSDVYKKLVIQTRKDKNQILKRVQELIEKELGEIHIKGISTRVIGQILAFANPHRFQRLLDFLRYCGYNAEMYYKNPAKGFIEGNLKHKYKHTAHLTWLMVDNGVLLQKDPNYYNGYLNLKQSFKAKHPEWRPYKIDAVAKNRVATLIMKEIYDRVNNKRALPPKHIVEKIAEEMEESSNIPKDVWIKKIVESELQKESCSPHTRMMCGEIVWVNKND